MICAYCNCLRLLMQWMPQARHLALARAGSSKEARMAMMAMTTSNSMSVNARGQAALGTGGGGSDRLMLGSDMRVQVKTYARRLMASSLERLEKDSQTKRHRRVARMPR